MKEILKNLPWMVVQVAAFLIISVMDLMLISGLLLIKATRLMFIWISDMVDPYHTKESFEELHSINNLLVNTGYKNCINLMYPEKEYVLDDVDEEEDEL